MREKIKKAMREQGLSASALAEKAGVRIASFTEYIADRKELRSDNLEKVFATLGIELKSAEELANSFESGSLYPIYERMTFDVPEKGVTENKQISKVQLASYICGLLAAKIARGRQNANLMPVLTKSSFSFLEKIVFQENCKSPYLFNRSVLKMAPYAEFWDDYEKELFSNICAEIPSLCTDKMDHVAFYAAFMRYYF